MSEGSRSPRFDPRARNRVDLAMSNGDEYQERYCAFVDILGFQGLVNRLREGRREYHTLKRLLETIHQPWRGGSSTPCGLALASTLDLRQAEGMPCPAARRQGDDRHGHS